MIRIKHVIAGLAMGGAETQLFNLVKYQTDTELQHTVISLGVSFFYEAKLRDAGIALYVLDIKKKPIITLRKLKKLLKESELIVCWMYAASAICYMITGPKEHKKMIWNIMHASLEPQNNSKRTLRQSEYCRMHSNTVCAVIYNGSLAMEIHKRYGFNEKHSYVVATGCNVQHFYKDLTARTQIDDIFPVEGKKIILSVGRYHPIKDYATMIHAMADLVIERDDVVLMMCGRMITEDNEVLVKTICDNGLQLEKNVFLLGEQDDIQKWMSAADIYVLHSVNEAFPNTLLEAMACECVCISTNVGPVKNLLKEEQIVGVQNAEQLAKRIDYYLDMPKEERNKLGKEERNLVENEYSMQKIIREYENIFSQEAYGNE